MNDSPDAIQARLCAAIEAALRLADASDNTLVSALLEEARVAASCRTSPA